MEALEEQTGTKATADKTLTVRSAAKSHNPGLRALLAIKNLTATLEKDYTELLHIESELEQLNKTGLLIIESNSLAKDTTRWTLVLQEVNKAITGINDTLTLAKEKIEKTDKEGYPELWKQLSVHLTALKDHSESAVNTGLALLPETVHPQWTKEFTDPKKVLVQSIVTHVESCRVLLQMIERYTPEELNTITKIIADQIPPDFTYEEAVDYANDYYKALVNFKNEFKEKKNLWDKFLDILAGGTHQSPSEGVMMERWLNGEKGEL
jgi:hypothetical protein